MRISEIMSRDVKVARPQDTIQSAARTMKEIDAGSMPVCEGEQLRGMITDRDIAIRAVGEGRSFDTPVSEVMTPQAHCCSPDDDVQDAAARMAKLQVRRLPVVDGERRLVGIVAIGDIALEGKDKRTGQTLEEISEPSRGQ